MALLPNSSHSETLSKTSENEIATLRRLLEDSQASETELQRNVEALQAQLLRTARAEQAARAELTKHREDSPRAKEIREVIDHYVTKFGKTKAFKCGPDTARWKAADRMLRMQYTVADLKEAVDGLHAMPFVGPHGRHPTDGQRHDELELVFRNEVNVDRFRGYVAKAAEQRVQETEQSFAQSVRQIERALPSWEDPVEAILSASTRLGLSWRNSPTGSAWFLQCPAHDDHTPSLNVAWNGAEDKLLVRCWAGCETVDVMAAYGLPLSVLFRSDRRAA